MSRAHPRVDEAILAHAATRPDAVALRHRAVEITFGELAARVEAAAAGLAAGGVGPGDVVAVRLPRGIPMVVVMLAVMRAGAAYSGLPLDWPDARCAEIVALTDARRTVTTESEVDDLVARGGPAVPPRTSAEEPFCVFLTSGSSGTAKATAAPHRALTRLVGDELFGFDADSTGLVQAPASWDAFTLELWLPLLAGGGCVVFDGTHLTAAAVRAAIASGANSLWLTASVFTALVEDDPGCLTGARQVVTGGERGSAKHMAACLEAHPDLRLVHIYGPVESTIAATALVVAPADTDGEVPIGTPVSGTGVHLLDEDLKPAAAGQVVLTGDGLTDGYLGDQTLTAAKFPVLPLGPDGAGVRAYLTGDRAFADDRGRFVFAGRTDRQLKIRGNRVEPAEVERVLESVPGVAEAAVFGVPADAPNVRWLAVCHRGTATAEALREAVRAVLPPAFVPDIVERVDRMPVTANGKVDRRALARNLKGFAGDDTSAGTADPRLRAVLGHLRALLGYAPAPDADLFTLGATSITAIRLANRLPDLDPADVVRLRTAAAISELVSADATTVDSPRPAIRHDPAKPARQQLPHWARERLASDRFPALTPVLLRLTGPLDLARLREALRAVVIAHETLRTCFAPSTGRGRVLAPSELPDLLATDGEVLPFLRKRFDLATEIPVRFLVVPDGPDRHLLACSFHHICFDAWSERVFVTDLVRAYRDGPAALAPRSYAEVAARQDAAVAPADVAAAADHWAGRLAGAGPLPLDSGAAALAAGPIGELPFELDAGLLAAADKAAAGLGSTATAVFLAAFARALRAEYTTGPLAVSVPVAGRRLVEADDLIGCFAEHVLFAFHGTGRTELAREAAGQLNAALTYPPVPQAELLRRIRSPLAGWLGYLQARFAVQDSGEVTERVPGLVVDRVPVPVEHSIVAVSLELWLGRLEGVFRYRTDLVDEDAVRRIAAAWHDETVEAVNELEQGRH